MTSPDYEAVMRERFGDLWRGSNAPEPDPRPRPSTSPRRSQPDPALAERRPPGLYTGRHHEIRAWIRRSHPEWLHDLYLLDAGQVAHVVEKTDQIGQGQTVCGRVGHLTPAGEDVVPCRTCAW